MFARIDSVRRFFRVAAGVLSIGLISLFLHETSAGQKEKQARTEKDSYVSSGKTINLSVALDQIGVLAKEGIANRALEKFAKSSGLTLVREYPGRIYIYSLKEPKSRKAIALAARNLKREWPKVVQEAGLVVTPEQSRTPMILTDEVIVQFKTNVKDNRILQLRRAKAVQLVRRNPFVKTQFLFRVTERSEGGALVISRQFEKEPDVEFAHPNFIPVVVYRQIIPNDTFFANQWHHRNTGQSGGTVDADIDTSEAWNITRGNANIIIAVIDSGFDTTHPDLTPNLWVNPGEVAGNNTDDDGNGFIDDINGWDFAANDNTLAGGNHGTAVAGCAGARGDNNQGVTGSSQICRLMLIRKDATTVFNHALAFGYARANGAEIITNSWGYAVGTPLPPVVVNAINTAALNGRGGLGCVVFFAMNNADINDCIGTTPDISSLPNVIAVSSCTNRDRKVREAAWGNCMDVLSTSHRNYNSPYFGTLNIVTTDVTGTAGYNSANPVSNCPSTEPANRSYTFCFRGTSAATPIAAGVAGLILSVNPNLTRIQVQRLLQDTCDKTEDSLGAYSTVNGFSSPAGGAATHGYGRINGFEAVRVAAPTANQGREGVDVVIRDNRLDWGNTEQRSNVLFEPVRGFIPHWESVDIKVDAPPYAAPPTTSAAFEAFLHENPIETQVNRVFVRARNRGPVTASKVRVKLHWAFAGTALPALPSDFWTAFPGDSSDTTKWHPLGVQTIGSLEYSGASVAGTGATDVAKVVQFNWTAPAINPANPKPRHHCLLVIMDCDQDSVSVKTTVVDFNTPRDNNITHRNVNLEDSTRSDRFKSLFYVRNPYEKTIRSMLRIEHPKDWKVKLRKLKFNDAFAMKPGEEILEQLEVFAPKEGQRGRVILTQERLDLREGKVIGGITYQYAPKDGFEERR